MYKKFFKKFRHKQPEIIKGVNKSLFQLLYELWLHIDFSRKKQILFTLSLMVLSAFAEVFSIGAALPFLGALTSPEKVFESSLLQPFLKALGATSSAEIILPLTIFFCLAVILSGAIRILVLWATLRLSFAIGADLSSSMYQKTLYQPYSVHISRNSSEVINGITVKSNSIVYNTIYPILNIITSCVVLISVLMAMMFIQPLISIVAFGCLGAIYVIIGYASRQFLKACSTKIATSSDQVIKSLQEGLGGIRDVLIDNSQAVYAGIYKNADRTLRLAQGSIQFIGASPRFAMEALGMILIALLGFRLSQAENGMTSAIPVLGALALGAQRLIPVLQQIFSSWSGIKGGEASLADVVMLLNQPLPKNTFDISRVKPIKFNKDIVLKSATFGYGSLPPWVINNLNLTIKKGSRVGFIGTTGCGKSTLLDILMGLLIPTKGELLVDGVLVTYENHQAWQRHIAHVPQSIYLADTTIAENIAFGVPKEEINMSLVESAASQAQMDLVIKGWELQYDTMVGERGVRLSGGQRQRIGIARALYKKADVIIFDEATSALDGSTEDAVMNAISLLSNDITILIVAHRESTLDNCNVVYRMDQGKISYA